MDWFIYGDDCPPTPTGTFLLRWAELRFIDPVIRLQPELWRCERLMLSKVPRSLVSKFENQSSPYVRPVETHEVGGCTQDDTVNFAGVEYRYLGREVPGKPSLGSSRPPTDASLLPWQLEREGHIWEREASKD